MSNKTNLENVSFDEIETNIMSVLYANIDMNFSQYALFNKVLKDKYDGQYSSQIHPNFKSKFLLVLRNLMSKYDDIKVSRNNGIYSVICVSLPESFSFGKIDNFKNWKYVGTSAIDLDLNDYATMYDYIYENNLTDYLNWSDPWDGNSIFHELVLAENKTQIKKLIEQDQFNYFTKNKHGQTPIELAITQEISNLLMSGLVQKFILLTEKFNSEKEQNKLEIKRLEDKINYLESPTFTNKIIINTSLLNFVLIKSENFYQNNRLFVLASFVCFLAIKYFF